MSKNLLTLIMETNKLKGTNYNDWLRNLRIVLNFENQGYVLDKPLRTALPEGSSPVERTTFKKYFEDNGKVCIIILASMTNNIQNEYDSIAGETSTSKIKGKRVGRWKRKKGKKKVIVAKSSVECALGKGKEKVGGSYRSRANDVCMHCHGMGHWKRECP
ncbi:hypothetical protein Sango_2818800 [Sesamum angolense]|uniref:CCHC-type domain-containing protein n=1 Tax=Sesamum angolense TaxID=2727404 RepID=A0AAE1W0Q5_9LAMI|nr:hypothetical protein Sango_2818800 [Sesamum angolense]